MNTTINDIYVMIDHQKLGEAIKASKDALRGTLIGSSEKAMKIRGLNAWGLLLSGNTKEARVLSASAGKNPTAQACYVQIVSPMNQTPLEAWYETSAIYWQHKCQENPMNKEFAERLDFVHKEAGKLSNRRDVAVHIVNLREATRSSIEFAW